MADEMEEREQAVRRMQEYILEHLQEPITLHELARQAGYSPYHCGRVFRERTGRTLFEYIRTLRLNHAAAALRDGRAGIVDVALDFVFGSQEGFTRAFSRAFGVSPARYRKELPPLRLFLPGSSRNQALRPVKGEDEMEKRTLGTVFVQVIQRPARKLLLRRGRNAEDYFAYCEEVGCEVWGELCGISEALYEPIGMWLPDAMRAAGTSRYAQGVEVPADYGGRVPEGMEVIGLPPCSMMVFQGPPFEDERFGEAIAGLWEAMDAFDPGLYGYRWADEDGPRFQMEPQGYRGYIEARPVRPLAETERFGQGQYGG